MIVDYALRVQFYHQARTIARTTQQDNYAVVGLTIKLLKVIGL